VATLQKLLGHADLASTMRYLRPAAGAALLSTMNRLFDGGPTETMDAVHR
jgi:integrase